MGLDNWLFSIREENSNIISNHPSQAALNGKSMQITDGQAASMYPFRGKKSSSETRPFVARISFVNSGSNNHRHSGLIGRYPDSHSPILRRMQLPTIQCHWNGWAFTSLVKCGSPIRVMVSSISTICPSSLKPQPTVY
jgi:hypothetical protein